jgi:dUTP pyrophosphatase
MKNEQPGTKGRPRQTENGTQRISASVPVDLLPLFKALGGSAWLTKKLQEEAEKPHGLEVRFKRLNADAKEPHAGTDGAAGLDLYATEETTLKRFQPVKVGTGLALEIPRGFCGKVYSRSSSFLKGLLLTPLIVDSDYRGEIFTSVMFVSDKEETYTIKKGDRIAQICIEPVTAVRFSESETLSETARGSGGYGSTGR